MLRYRNSSQPHCLGCNNTGGQGKIMVMMIYGSFQGISTVLLSVTYPCHRGTLLGQRKAFRYWMKDCKIKGGKVNAKPWTFLPYFCNCFAILFEATGKMLEGPEWHAQHTVVFMTDAISAKCFRFCWNFQSCIIANSLALNNKTSFYCHLMIDHYLFNVFVHTQAVGTDQYNYIHVF